MILILAYCVNTFNAQRFPRYRYLYLEFWGLLGRHKCKSAKKGAIAAALSLATVYCFAILDGWLLVGNIQITKIKIARKELIVYN